MLALAGLLLAGSHLAPPILFIARDPSELDPGAVFFVIRNPLREIGPEKAGSHLFRELRAGHCAEAFPSFHATLTAQVCANENRWPVQSWSVINRKDDREHGESRIHYRVTRRNYQSASNVWITVELDRGEYRVKDFNAGY